MCFRRNMILKVKNNYSDVLFLYIFPFIINVHTHHESRKPFACTVTHFNLDSLVSALVMTLLLFFLKRFVYLFAWKRKRRRGEREKSSTCLFTPQMSSMVMGLAGTRSQEFHTSILSVWQEPKYLDHCLLFL